MVTGTIFGLIKFQHLEASFKAGAWIGTPLPNGPSNFVFPLPGGVFLGRATLWKLQTGLHIDKDDYLCAITCSGSYDGGNAIFPDITTKLMFVFSSTKVQLWIVILT